MCTHFTLSEIYTLFLSYEPPPDQEHVGTSIAVQELNLGKAKFILMVHWFFFPPLVVVVFGQTFRLDIPTHPSLPSRPRPTRQTDSGIPLCVIFPDNDSVAGSSRTKGDSIHCLL